MRHEAFVVLHVRVFFHQRGVFGESFFTANDHFVRHLPGVLGNKPYRLALAKIYCVRREPHVVVHADADSAGDFFRIAFLTPRVLRF